MLRWNDDAARYHCGLLAETAGALPWVPAWLRRAATRLARRWISAGSGCDSELEVASTAATR